MYISNVRMAQQRYGNTLAYSFRLFPFRLKRYWGGVTTEVRRNHIRELTKFQCKHPCTTANVTFSVGKCLRTVEALWAFADMVQQRKSHICNCTWMLTQPSVRPLLYSECWRGMHLMMPSRKVRTAGSKIAVIWWWLFVHHARWGVVICFFGYVMMDYRKEIQSPLTI